MDFKRVELNESVDFTHIYTEIGKYNSLSVSFVCELTDKNATALTLASKILSHGTEQFPTLQAFSRACDDNYATYLESCTYKTGEKLVLDFYLGCLKNEYALDNEDIFKTGMNLLNQMIFHPFTENGHFADEYVLREKSALREQLAAIKNNKRAYAISKASKIMFKNEPYSIQSSGDEQTLEALDSKEITDIYNDIIANSAVHIVFAGNSGYEEIKNLLNEFLPFDHRKSSLNKAIKINNIDSIKTITENTDAKQSVIVMGFRIKTDVLNKKRSAFSIFSSLLCKSQTSKLFMNVREKLGLCYYCNELSDKEKSVMMIFAGIDGKNYEKMYSAVLHEIDDIKNGIFTDDEFTSALKSRIYPYKTVNDDNSHICEYYTACNISGRIISPEDEINLLLSVSKADVVSIASDLILDTVYFLKGN